MTEVSLILLQAEEEQRIVLQAEEKQRNDTSGSGVPSSSRPGSAISAVAFADERRHADESQPHLQRPQAGLQVPQVQAQPQVQSQVCLLVSPKTASVLYFPGST